MGPPSIDEESLSLALSAIVKETNLMTRIQRVNKFLKFCVDRSSPKYDRHRKSGRLKRTSRSPMRTWYVLTANQQMIYDNVPEVLRIKLIFSIGYEWQSKRDELQWIIDANIINSRLSVSRVARYETKIIKRTFNSIVKFEDVYITSNQ